MKEELPRYPAYQPTGIDLISKIPVGWEILPLKRVANIRTGVAKGRKLDDINSIWLPYLRVANVQDGYLDLNDIAEIEILYSEIERFSLKKGDVLMNEGGDADKLGRGHVWDGNINPCLHQNHVFAIRSKGISPNWLSTITGSSYAKAYFEIKAKRTTNLASISKSNLAELPVVVAPIEEQNAILSFLDRETAKIDRLMDVRRKQIETLQEQRTTVIHHAVTKGIDPQAKMKPSGVEWLGDIPEEWQVYRLKFTAKIKNGQDYKTVEAEDGYPVIGSGGQFAFANQYLYEGESVLFGRKGTINKPLYINGRFWTVDTMFYTQVKNCIIPKFLYYCAVGFPFEYYSTQTALPSMTQQDIGNHPIALPSLIKQKRIVAYIEYETRKTDTLISKYQRELEFLAEYRASLISHAVTGKIDIRGLAES